MCSADDSVRPLSLSGVDIFAKGANLIPAHIFAPRERSPDGAAQWRWLLTQAAQANMNMVRVWGGGRYQDDAFYQLTDELGLMVWQVRFACTRGHT